MRFGILSDVHENVTALRYALDVFEQENVDQSVFLGDLYQTGEGFVEAAELLLERQIPGVWGNHDFDICRLAVEQPKKLARLFHQPVVEPWKNAYDSAALWDISSPLRLRRCFRAVKEAVTFCGHHHRWLIATPRGVLNWSGQEVLTLDDGQRHFILVHALKDGHFATYDTEKHELAPYSLAH